MTTTLRDARPGIHHIWLNATGNEDYFIDEIDRMTWIRDLIATAARFELTCVAFCQITTHWHLVLRDRAGSLSSAMQLLNCGYSRRFNTRHGRQGQFVRRRFGNRRIEGRADLLGTFAYVVLNSTKAGLCPRPEDWRWSSYATSLGISNDYPFVDASIVIAEAGSVEQLRSLVDARWRDYLAKEATAGRLTTGRVRAGQAVRP